MKKQQQGSKGYILVGVMIIALILSVLAMASMSKGGGLEIAAERARQSSQNLWFCESGMAQTVANFYSGDFSGFSAAFADSGRAVDVDLDVSYEGENADGKPEYMVVATASSGGEDVCKVQQRMTVERDVPPSPDLTSGLIFGGNTNGVTKSGEEPYVLILKNCSNTGNHGSKFTAALAFGNASIHSGADITSMDIQISGTCDSSNGKVVDNADIHPPTELFELLNDKMDEYAGKIASGGNSTVKYADNLNLNIPSGTTVVLKGSSGSADVNISNINISGGGTLIVKGKLTLNNGANFNLSSGIALLIGGDLVGKNSSNFNVNSSDAEVYVGGAMDLANSGSLNVQGSLMVEKSISLKNGSFSKTFIFCNDYMEVKNSATIEGILICNQLIAKNSSNIYMNENCIPNMLNELMKGSSGGTGGEVIDVTCSDWKKVSL
jgi:hypothetical protein